MVTEARVLKRAKDSAYLAVVLPGCSLITSESVPAGHHRAEPLGLYGRPRDGRGQGRDAHIAQSWMACRCPSSLPTMKRLFLVATAADANVRRRS